MLFVLAIHSAEHANIICTLIEREPRAYIRMLFVCRDAKFA
jgi:hypothetical protein